LFVVNTQSCTLKLWETIFQSKKFIDESNFILEQNLWEAVVVVIAWKLDLQLPVQSPLTLLVWVLHRWDILNTTLCDRVCKWLAAGRWFSPGTLVSSTNKTDRHDITEILLKVTFITINPPFRLNHVTIWFGLFVANTVAF